MISTNWERVFANLKSDEASLLVLGLHQNGFILEEGTFITKAMLYEAFPNLKNWFFQQGYKGGELSLIGNYFQKYGACFMIYDNTRFDYRAASEKLAKIYQ